MLPDPKSAAAAVGIQGYQRTADSVTDASLTISRDNINALANSSQTRAGVNPDQFVDESRKFAEADSEPQPELYNRQGQMQQAAPPADLDAADATEQPADADPASAADSDTATGKSNAAGEALTPEQEAQLLQLQQRDREVRLHEQQHASVGGQHTGSPQYEYETGPDGKQYVVEGSVSVDLSPVANDPGATIAKMQQVKAAALAPAEPSQADKNAAARADQHIAQARAEQVSDTESQPATAATPALDADADADTGGAAPPVATPAGTRVSNTMASTPAAGAITASTTATTGGVTAQDQMASPGNQAGTSQMALRNQVIAGVYGSSAHSQAHSLLNLA